MHSTEDTICAQATPAGEGGIAIVRMSGRDARRILGEVFRPAGTMRDRMLTYGRVVEDGTPLDEAMAVMMPGPASYTREDVAEIHCHGSQTVVSRVLSLLMAHGARPARPGEFTYRAFIGGRIDLAQAEGVMRMVRSDSDRAIRGALRQMEGGVSSFVQAARSEIVEMLSDLAAAIDFPDEVDEQQTAEALRARCLALARRLEAACDPLEGRLEDEGLRIALYGRPNAGKSSLLNALLGEDRAIVTAVPGTTRDVLSERTQIDGLSVVLTDTAGLRETEDEVEQIGVARARRAMEEADARVLVLDGGQAPDPETRSLAEDSPPDLIVISKGDLPQQVGEDALRAAFPGVQVLTVSSRTGEGLDALRRCILSFAQRNTTESAALTQLRHVEAARRACASLEAAARSIEECFTADLAGIDLSGALDALGEITGETMNERVIDAVFERFCVGK